MKIVLAPDKFKNSLTGLEFCKAVEEGIKAVLKSDVDIVKLPLADGGDGTIEVVNYYLKGKVVHVEVNNPFFQLIKASYLYSESSKMAFIEMAEASGVKLLKSEQLDCKNATTLGTGEIIVDAIKKGAQKIILGIGGSATNDCGIGMAMALGYRFLDKNNNEVKPIGANLSKIESIDVTNVHDRLYEVEFSIACDVTNLLYGANGAAYVYGAQKGASLTDIKMLDTGLKDFSKILNAVFNIDAQSVKGAGAAGGMGIASKVFLKGDLKSGIELVKHLADFDAKIKNSEWIITGEGRLDSQTFSGKTIKGIVDSAKKDGIKIAAFCGSTNLNRNSIKDFGIDYVDLVDNYSKNKNDAIQNGFAYLRHIAKIFAKKLA
jgi:glycerate kinase